MFDEFFVQLVAALNKIGIDSYHPHSGSCRIQVGDCSFEANYPRRSNSRTVTFEGVKFKRPYDISKAIDLIIQLMPDKVKQTEESKEKQRRHDEARAISKMMCDNVSVYTTGVETNNKFAMEFIHSDKLTIMAAIDCLQDNGFFSDNAPKVIGAEFKIHKVKRILKSLSPEERQEVINSFLSPSEQNN